MIVCIALMCPTYVLGACIVVLFVHVTHLWSTIDTIVVVAIGGIVWPVLLTVAGAVNLRNPVGRASVIEDFRAMVWQASFLRIWTLVNPRVGR